MKTNRMCAILGNVTKYDTLLPLTNKRPLATLPFDAKYRLIDFPLSSIVNSHINTVFMVFNEGETQSVFDHIGGGKEWNLDALQNRYFVYFYQDFLKQKELGLNYYESLIDYLEKSKSAYTVYLGSKMLCNIDLRAVLKIHRTQKNDMTLVYKRMESEKICSSDTILDIVDGGKVSGSHKFDSVRTDNEKENLFMDIFMVDTQWLINELREAVKRDESTNIREFLTQKINAVNSSTYEYTGYLSNIHDVKSYYDANMDMLEPTKFNSLLYSSQKIYTKVKNEVPTYYSKESSVKNSQFATGSIIEGTVENSLVSRNAFIKSGANVSDSIIMTGGTVKANATVEYAIIDKNVVVEEGVTIRGTKAHPICVEKGAVVMQDIFGGE